MLAFCTGQSEISLVLGSSDARWLGEEMSFLAELYRSKASGSERQFGEDNNAALASFLETAAKCQQLSVALQQAVRRGYRREDDSAPSDQHASATPAIDLPCWQVERSPARVGCEPHRLSKTTIWGSTFRCPCRPSARPGDTRLGRYGVVGCALPLWLSVRRSAHRQFAWALVSVVCVISSCKRLPFEVPGFLLDQVPQLLTHYDSEPKDRVPMQQHL
jgi:hypothetical protein